jgi:hypothetical protein
VLSVTSDPSGCLVLLSERLPGQIAQLDPRVMVLRRFYYVHVCETRSGSQALMAETVSPKQEIVPPMAVHTACLLPPPPPDIMYVYSELRTVSGYAGIHSTSQGEILFQIHSIGNHAYPWWPMPHVKWPMRRSAMTPFGSHSSFSPESVEPK